MAHDSHNIKIAQDRKRAHSHKWEIFDKLIWPAAIAGPILTIPQVIQIFSSQTAAGVSLTSWTAYLTITFFWFIYSLLHREWPLIINSALWMLANSAVIAGILIYG